MIVADAVKEALQIVLNRRISFILNRLQQGKLVLFPLIRLRRLNKIVKEL